MGWSKPMTSGTFLFNNQLVNQTNKTIITSQFSSPHY
jgi:hypothetical protein